MSGAFPAHRAAVLLKLGENAAEDQLVLCFSAESGEEREVVLTDYIAAVELRNLLENAAEQWAGHRGHALY